MTKDTYDNMYVYRLNVSNNNDCQNSLLEDRYSKLKMLNINNNKNITDISMFAETLEVLYMSNTILDVGNLACMKKLRVLRCDREFDDLCINDLTNLHNTIRVLRTNGSQADQSDLSKFKKIKKLYIYSDYCIADVRYISKTIYNFCFFSTKKSRIPDVTQIVQKASN